VSRRRRLLLGGVALLVATPIALLAGLRAVGNTDPGRRLVERLTVRLSGGHVIVSGLAGDFPSDLRAGRVELWDAQGPWLMATDITLRSSPGQLLRRHAQVALLSAGYVGLARAPAASAPARGQTDRRPFLRRLDVDSLQIARFEIGAALAGADAVLELQGSVHVGVADDARAALSARRLDGPGVYEFVGQMDRARVGARLDVREPAGGPLANLAGLPGLGDLSLQLRIDGPRAAETTHLTVAAGPLHAAADGTVNWTARVADLEVSAAAPSMTPRPDLSWESLSLQGRYHGAFSAPAVTAQVKINGARVGGVRFRSLGAEVRGDAGTATAAATLEGLRLPGPKPALLEASPIELRVDANLADPARPMTFSLSHPLVSVRGRATAGERPSATFTATLPSFAPFADVMGVDLRGQATISGKLSSADGEVQAAVTGTMKSAGGSAVWGSLIGAAATLDLSVARRGTVLTIDHARLDAGALRASINGTDRDGLLDLRWTLTLPNLAALAPTLAGSALVHGEIRGALDNFGGSADAKTNLSIQGSRPGAIDIAVRAQGLPRRPSATLDARGTIDDAPVRLAAVFEHQADGGTRAFIRRADWRSASASGDVTLPAGSSAARGRLSLHMSDLQDLRRIAGEPLQGSVTGTVNFSRDSGRGRAEIHLEALRAGLPDRLVGRLVVSGRIDEPTSDPVFALHAVAEDIVTPMLSGTARLEALGPARGVALKLSSRWHGDGPDAAEVISTATLDLRSRRLGVATLEAKYRGQTARLLTPTRLYFRDGTSFDVVRIGVQKAVLEIAGTVSPTLNASASLKNAPLALLAIVRPAWQAEGLITADARLTGTVAAPEGTLHVSGKGLRVRSGAGRGMPLTDVVATADLHGNAAAIDLRVHADTAADLRLVGTVPLRSDQPFDLRANGQVALATANPFLEPNGRRVGGQVTIDANLRGTRAAPLLGGTMVLDHGDFQDFVRGTHLSDVSLTLRATERSVRVTRLLAHAGSGTVSAEGTIGLLEPALPVDLRLTAVNAQPLSSDLLTARVDATLTIRGEANGRLEVLGRVRVNRADITIPNAFPREVAVLDVRRAGAKPVPPPRRAAAPIGLDIAVEAPRAVFVRGRGIDAELGGDLHVSGTSAAPQFSGGFDMRRGTLALAGASLKFTSGRVSFNGAGVKTTLDPTLDFVADSTSTDVTATLTVGGYASAPTVVLTSTPELPQDEILARLLFGQSAKQLTALQLLRIGVALASISGAGYGGTDPLAAFQRRLGLDRLAVGAGTGPDSNAATVEAGRYATERVYVGAAQSTSGATKLQVQVDLTKHLKLQTVVGSGSGAAQGTTPQNDPGNTIGLSYQIDY
jgi:translocation and assembly module TamB